MVTSLIEMSGIEECGKVPGPTRIPNRFHFVGGLTRRGRSFGLVNYLCVASCLEVNRPEAVYFSYRHEPVGPYWDQIKDRIVPIAINAAPPRSYLAELCPNVDSNMIAQRADFVRLATLLDHGGIAASTDTLFVNRLPARLMSERFVLGEIASEASDSSIKTSAAGALGKEFIMSERGSTGARRWLGALGPEQSQRDAETLKFLRRVDPALVHVEPPRSFYRFAPTPAGIGRLMRQRPEDLADVLTLQPWSALWARGSRLGGAGFAWGLLTENFIRQVDSTYCLAARPFLPRPQPRFWRIGRAREQGRRLLRKCQTRVRQEAFGAVALAKVVILKLFGKWIFPNDAPWHLNVHLHQWRHRDCLSRFTSRSGFESNIIKSVAVWNEYGVRNGEFAADDVVIDIGGHVGSFSYLAHKAGSRNIHSFEPEIENYRRLSQALAGLPGIRAYNLAVFRSDIAPGYRLIHSGYCGDNTGAGNVILGGRLIDSPNPGILDSQPQLRAVTDVVSFDHVLSRFGQVRLIKLDCEGSEFPILLTSQQLHKVQCIVGEFHELDAEMTAVLDDHARLGGASTYQAAELKSTLESAGFRVDLTPAAEGRGHFKAVRMTSASSPNGTQLLVTTR